MKLLYKFTTSQCVNNVQSNIINVICLQMSTDVSRLRVNMAVLGIASSVATACCSELQIPRSLAAIPFSLHHSFPFLLRPGSWPHAERPAFCSPCICPPCSLMRSAVFSALSSLLGPSSLSHNPSTCLGVIRMEPLNESLDVCIMKLRSYLRGVGN